MSFWTPEKQARLVEKAASGATGSEIAADLGTTRNAVMGRAHRTGVKLPMDETKHRRMTGRRDDRPPLPKPTPGRRGSYTAKRDEVRRRYIAGEKLADIAVATGVPLVAIGGYCRDLPKRRPNSGCDRRYSWPMRVAFLAEAFAGSSFRKVSRRHGVTVNTLRKWQQDGALVADARALAARVVTRAKAEAEAERQRQAQERADKEALAAEINAPVLAALPPRTRAIIERRIDGETLEAIAADYGVTRERIRQIEASVRARTQIVLLDRKPLSDAAAAKFGPKHGKRGPKPKVQNASDIFERAHAILDREKPRRAMRLSETERERRREHGRRMAAARWSPEARA